MSNRTNISFDSELMEAISAQFDLRDPNKEALRQLIFTLDGPYDPDIMQVLSLATGVGKTYLMAAFIEYLRHQGVGNVVIVTPGKTVQSKTVQNFQVGSPRYIEGSPVPPEIVTPHDYSAWVARINGSDKLTFGREIPTLAFVFNIQQLIAPKSEEGETRGSTQDAIRRKPRKFDENAGVLFDYLSQLDDLVVIADESHLYGTTAKAFHAALKELAPSATIGLTASADRKKDHVIFEYPLYKAIQDKYVKTPVLAFRRGGYGSDEKSEEQQLRDALRLRETKQSFYDSFTASQNQDHLNAIVFVVCADVSHASQVVDLLRSPEFLGHKDAVLQVDSQHDDDETQRKLENLDDSHSPVLAVVSVNKLKEGWDVKNIAVVVTLRAMASDVLTQQTMGRGLRLPFGRYTGIENIDQLDIIAHQSFEELLRAEDVLKQFGLEEAIQETEKSDFREQIKRAAQQKSEGSLEDASATGNHGQDNSPHPDLTQEAQSSPSSDSTANPSHTSQPGNSFGNGETDPTTKVRELRDPVTDEGTPEWQTVTIQRNSKFIDESYFFPVTRINLKQPTIQLSEINNSQLELAARRVTSSGDVLLRKEIVAALGKKLKVVNAESAEVDSIPIAFEDAATALTKLVLNMMAVPKDPETARIVSKYLVPRFMNCVTFPEWTVKSLASARAELQHLIHSFINETLRSSREVATIHPKRMPGNEFALPWGETIHHQISSRKEFQAGRFYAGWRKSLFTAESFDSYSGEYALATLLDTSPNIRWWHRLHSQDQAFIYYNSKDRYFPDFVAKDSDGIHWIIEGKDERGRDDSRVQAKRKAAEDLVRRLVAVEEYADQHWGYLIAYEKDTERSDSWDDLKARSQPISNAI